MKVIKYDFDLIKSFLEDYGIKVEIHEEVLTAHLTADICMNFYNESNPNDVRCDFGSEWHCHSDFYFFGEEYHIELSYLDFLEELVNGNILICSEYVDGKLEDIEPDHIEYFDKSDFKYLGNNKELRIKRLKFDKIG